MLSRLRGESGISKITLAVFGTIFGVAFFAIYNILPFYYYYFEIQNQAEAMARVAQEYKDKEIRLRLEKAMSDYQIPAEPEDLKIQRMDGMIEISLEYEEILSVGFEDRYWDIHVFPFHVYVNQKYWGGIGICCLPSAAVTWRENVFVHSGGVLCACGKALPIRVFQLTPSIDAEQVAGVDSFNWKEGDLFAISKDVLIIGRMIFWVTLRSYRSNPLSLSLDLELKLPPFLAIMFVDG